MTALLDAPVTPAATTEPFRVIVTGSRTWTAVAPIRRELEHVYEETGYGPLVVVHGNARGADRIARDWAREAAACGHDVTEEGHDPDYERYGKAAPFVRNEEMVSLGARVALIFQLPCELSGGRCRRRRPHGTHGTEQCSNRAAAAGIEVRRFDD